jgi:hypothetical protein
MDKSKYCILVIKAINAKLTPQEILEFYMKGLYYTLTLNDVAIVNLSLGGESAHLPETALLRFLMLKGVKIVAATGNSKNRHMHERCTYFPVCSLYKEKRFYSVSSRDSMTPNDGVNMNFHYEKFCGGSPNFCGTSQATAYFTGKLAQ